MCHSFSLIIVLHAPNNQHKITVPQHVFINITNRHKNRTRFYAFDWDAIVQAPISYPQEQAKIYWNLEKTTFYV